MAFLQSDLFLGFFSREAGQFRSTWAHIGKEEKGVTLHQEPISSSGEMMMSVEN